MHEMSLMKDLVKKVLKVCQENNGTKVIEVEVWLGALSHLSEDHFAEHFVEEARGTPAEGARLKIEKSDDLKDARAQELLLKGIQIDSTL